MTPLDLIGYCSQACQSEAERADGPWPVTPWVGETCGCCGGEWGGDRTGTCRGLHLTGWAQALDASDVAG